MRPKLAYGYFLCVVPGHRSTLFRDWVWGNYVMQSLLLKAGQLSEC